MNTRLVAPRRRGEKLGFAFQIVAIMAIAALLAIS
jgi:hypothetical protein